jgi:hypothetical protein
MGVDFHAQNAIGYQTEIYRRLRELLFRGYIESFTVVEGHSLIWVIKVPKYELELTYDVKEVTAFIRGVEAGRG